MNLRCFYRCNKIIQHRERTRWNVLARHASHLDRCLFAIVPLRLDVDHQALKEVESRYLGEGLCRTFGCQAFLGMWSRNDGE